MKVWLISATREYPREICGARLSEKQARREVDEMNRAIKKKKYELVEVEVR